MPIGSLPVLGIAEYNGYAFNETTETVAYSVQPVYDASRRTVTASTFTMTLKWLIADEILTSAEAADIVARLQRPAGELIYEGRGFGAERVNRGRVQDVDWGPRPGEVKFTPHAGKATECQWTVTFTIPTCGDAVYEGIREFCFTVDYAQDASGYSTRTYNATVKIAQTRRAVDDRRVRETADDYYEKIVPAKIPGFRRESQTRRLSLDRNELTVTVVDVELPPAVLPSGLISASVEHTYSAVPNTNLKRWTGSFSASYEVATRDGNVGAAVQDFFALTKDRITRARSMTADGVGGAPGAPVGDTLIITTFSATDGNVYGRQTARFTLGYTIAGVSLTEILKYGGLWTPWNGPGASRTWAGWHASVPHAFGPRGNADLVFRASDDRILDLCGVASTVTPSSPPSDQTPSGNRINVAARAIAQGAVSARDALQQAFPPPGPEKSWLDYRQYVSITADTGRVVGNTLPTAPLSADAGGQGTWNALADPLPRSGPQRTPFPPLSNLLGGQGAGSAFVQQRTSPTLYVSLHGYAVRVNHEIPCPELVTVNGKSPTLVGRPEFHAGVVGNAQYPVYAASWRLTYVFAEGQDLTGRVPVPPNPTLA